MIVRTTLIACFCYSAVAAQIKQETLSVKRLQLLNVYELPHNIPFQGTTVGGLSGIDYDKENDVYYMICDDRSAINPARFYTAQIRIRSNRIDTVEFVNVNSLLQKNGSIYPNSKQNPARTPDPEAMRYDALRKRLIWSSEGERIVKDKQLVLSDPSINIMSMNGRMTDSVPIPNNMRMHKNEKGPRQNGVLEGMSFADNYHSLFVNVEEPLYEDGPRADLVGNKAWIRIYKFDAATKKNTAQYAYKLERIAHAPILPDAFKINGVPDILWIGNDKMIVMERSFSTGRMACTIRLFLTDLHGAEDIRNNSSLKTRPPRRPLQKKLLLNLDSLGIYVDNVEGMTIGPVLPNGHKTLILVADNNFMALEKTQFFLFEVIP